ncbi:MAG: tRNA lysidine(34) synthetase TilS, partial [Coriobacteriales bacterium]
FVLHVNHLLRGTAADEDADAVRALCAQQKVPCSVVRYDVAGFAKAEGLNLEDAGRRVRYALAESELDARCADLGLPGDAGRIATGHTLDDQLETFLMRLVTGSGPGGLRAIQAVRGRVVRPLIEARRSEVVAYLDELGQTWREDTTNADTSRLRSWVRHELLPLIEGVNPSFHETLARTIRILAEEDSLLAEMADAFAADFAHFDGTRLSFERQMMATLSPAMARRTLRQALIRAFPEASRIEAEHIDALAAGIHNPRFARDLSFGLRAEVEYDKLNVFGHEDAIPPVAPCLLTIPGVCALGPYGTITATLVEPGEVTGDPMRAVIDADRVSGELVVDAPREGDRIRPLGMTGTKKVGDLLTDAKVPRRLRRVTPVVRDGERIVWVAGVRMSDEFKVTPATRRAVALLWTREDNSR